MGKGKRNKQRRNYYGGPLEEANSTVRQAEATLLEARQRAAAIADAEAQRQSKRHSYDCAPAAGLAHTHQAHTPVDLDDAGGRSPQDQANAFFSRPGDYFLTRFTITADHHDPEVVESPKAIAETVLKASEDQLDYLLEVLRQIRGGFGDRCRIELRRAHTVEHGPAVDHEPPPAGQFDELIKRADETKRRARDQVDEVIRATEDSAASQAREMLREQIDGPPPPTGFTLPPPNGHPKPAIPDGPPQEFGRDWDTSPLGRPLFPGDPLGEPPKRDLTREELAAQLPGQTRAEVAAELGKTPEEIGGKIVQPGEVSRAELAAELGIPIEALQPLPMRGGGTAYAIKPPEPPPVGRHAAPDRDGDTESPETALRGWCCGTPITGPHIPGCNFEPRADNPIDYGGPATIQEPQP